MLSGQQLELMAIAHLQRWAKAWSQQDVAAYIASYIDYYTPVNDQSHTSWLALRTSKLTKPKGIAVSLSDVSVRLLNKYHAVAHFTQAYKADHYSDEVSKTINLIRVGSQWKIASEETK
jgi:hypothetical protein